MANNETYTCSPSEVCLSDSDSELLIPNPWSDESKNEKGQKGREKNSNGKDHCLRLTLQDVPLNNNIVKQIGDFVDMSSEAMEQGMDANVPDEIDGAKGEQVPNHVVKKGNLEFLVCKEVVNLGVNELVDKGIPLKRKRVKELENELTSREELAVLQVEFADMEGQMQQLMEELKKSQKNAFFWKSTAIRVANHGGDELVDKGRPLKRKRVYAE
ncbi:hypothetical protein Tco_0738729 [Tanacetum coccineum]